MTTSTILSSLDLYARDLDRTAAFYRALGIPLEYEDRDGEPPYFGTKFGDVHFAILAAPLEQQQQAARWEGAGSDFAGFYVDSLDGVSARLVAEGTHLVDGHRRMPWGCRVVAEDPDGRAVEVVERRHCPRAETTEPAPNNQP